ncbi:MAG: trans-aconitate 2-methyltransferase [Actinomycetota bacterium]|jgi:trans-aconitate 2-methyltransferase|nr:trans-aconitate 2-methyltransferase [Actinomycetota bacterium]
MWDPGTYLRYAAERGRPFAELLARVGATSPRRVVDLGCGPGVLTAGLADRWPEARVEGLDSSSSMIERADSLGSPVSFRVADVREWTPEPDTDVVISHATLQWVRGHEALLRDWVAALPGGAWLAFGVPGNFDAPSHRLLRSVARSAAWRGRLAAVELRDAPVLDAAGYASLLRSPACEVDAWETTYVHVLPVGDDVHPVLAWLSGTALRPVRAALDDTEWAAFTADLGGELAKAYPVDATGVLFPFRRIFVVARAGGRPGAVAVDDRPGPTP